MTKLANRGSRAGLILLVVLGMLALFSLLAVTYVVFSSQSKAASVALANSQIRGKQDRAPLLEEAIMSLVRGPAAATAPNSAMFGHDLLGDLYGGVESMEPLQVSIRNSQLSPTGGLNSPMSYAADAHQRPMILHGHFLRIPLQPTRIDGGTTFQVLPLENDVLTGRVVTFMEGSGPLSGQSFRIIRYIGQMPIYPSPTPDQVFAFSQCFSILIDLNEGDLSSSYSGIDDVTNRPVTQSIGDWVSSTGPSAGWSAGVYACYAQVGLDPAMTLAGGYDLMINAATLNSHGVGVLPDGSSQFHRLYPRPTALGTQVFPNLIYDYATALQPNYSEAVKASPLGGSFEMTTNSQTVYGNQLGTLGDSDEPYDAADFQNMFLAYTSAADSSDIIPSFHRPALINYIVNTSDPALWTEVEFLHVLRRIQLAMIRPISFSITTPSGNYISHSEFSGSNPGSGGTSLRLQMVVNDWSDWPTTGMPIFFNWVNALINGPWDVNNRGGSSNDSMWVDPGLPLQQSAEGQLLKVMAAYYVEDLDGKLDVNACSSLAQANAGYVTDRQYTSALNTAASNNLKYLFQATSFAEYGNADFLAQGFGYGPAETSMRHLFSKSPLITGLDSQEAAYLSFLQGRYGSDLLPGNGNDDTLSQLDAMRERIVSPSLPPLNSSFVYRHGAFPGLPMDPFGRTSWGLDRLGNPLLWNILGTITDESNNDPYESRWMVSPLHDTPYTIPEWERIYRIGDSDRSAMPDRLEAAFGENSVTLAASTLRNEITPISRHLRRQPLGIRSDTSDELYHMNGGVSLTSPVHPDYQGAGPGSTLSALNEILVYNGSDFLNGTAPAALTEDYFRFIFPLEFHRGEGMNLNRPFGNGVDDNNNGQIDEIDEFLNTAGTLYTGQAARYANSGAIGTVAVGENYFEGAVSKAVTTADTVAARLRLSSLECDTFMDYSMPPNMAAVPSPMIPHSNPRYWGNETRQLYARHLYCLAQAILPMDYWFPSIDRTYWQDLVERSEMAVASALAPPVTDPLAEADVLELLQLRGRILAQWAVNVVDFRDGDSAMTRFPYDPIPFDNDWDVTNGGGANVPNVVWGMEQPELLLTESLAFHDIRVRQDPDASSPDRFDQFRRPEGSLFLELYCPRTTGFGASAVSGPALGDETQQAQGASSNLYTVNGNGTPALNVGATAPNGVPVFRVYIGKAQPVTTGGTPAMDTPNERLMGPSLDARRHDLTYQLPESNIVYEDDGSGGTQMVANADEIARLSGLTYDYHVDAAETLQGPDINESRVVVFTPGFSPDISNTPGVTSTSQVFYNQATTGSQLLAGGQYLTVAPRVTTYFGSKTTAIDATTDEPHNRPNNHRIQLLGGGGSETLPGGAARGHDWTEIRLADNTAVPQRATMADSEVLVAAADAPSTWSNADALQQVGLNVSEPLSVDATTYYDEPTTSVNTNDTMADPDNGAPGFATATEDGYFDYGSAGMAPARAPFDDIQDPNSPLQDWVLDDTAGPQENVDFIDLDGDTMLSADDCVAPGTRLDWTTAYLQRLADPSKDFHPTFNPYITIDWIPIDLTVFNGEDDDNRFDPSSNGAPILFASRQKTGQMLDSRSLSYDPAGGTGETFYSLMTDKPDQNSGGAITNSTPNTTSTSFWQFELDVDAGATPPTRPTAVDGTTSFCTLGFLNSTYKLFGQNTVLNGNPVLPTDAFFPARFRGAPAEPVTGNADANWHPNSLFWPNRGFVSALELMRVPTSSPCQIMQEFSATPVVDPSRESLYAPPFVSNDSGSTEMPNDPRTPTAPYSPEYPGTWPTGADTTNTWPPAGGAPPISGEPNTGLDLGTGPAVNVEPEPYFPYAYLLNFFQEAPERRTPAKNPAADPNNSLHPKATSLAHLLEFVETPSPWTDAYRLESPLNLQVNDVPAVATNFQGIAAAENILFAPLRPPYNGVSTFIEPGRINLNTVAGQNVLQGLGSNLMLPSNVDFPPYQPTQPFGQANDIDHDDDGVFDAQGGRTLLGAANTFMTTMWDTFAASRQGYVVGGATGFYQGFYTPPGTARFNPHLPTRFANVFRPASEAGMVPVTRNPFANAPVLTPGDANYDAGYVAHRRLARRAENRGVLDLFAHENPNFVTLLRGIGGGTFSGHDVEGDSIANDSTGLITPGASPLFFATGTQRNPMLDFYPMTRLQNLTTGRSNVFAVYVTVGLFEYDDSTDQLGVEFGADRGEQQRFKAFYVIDRTVPVAYQTGVDHNAANTIIVRRLLNSEDEQ